jgi:hypothetical protein
MGERRGDTLSGIVDSRETFTSKKSYDGKPPKSFEVIGVETADRVRRVPCARQHLAQLVAEHDPQPGDGIAITYFGQEPGGKRELYAMRVAKAASLAEPERSNGSPDDEPPF